VYVYHYISVKINTKKKAPYFTGSMLRGAFGHALKKVTCINPTYKCEGCFAAENCVYYQFYEKETLQPKFRFDITLESDTFDFGFYLFGDACTQLPYVLSSLEMALGQNGLGKDRTRFTDITMEVDGLTVYENHAFLPHITSVPQKLTPSIYTPNIKVKLLTPLRIKQDNKIAHDSVALKNIIRSVYQRKQQIFENEQVHSLPHKPTFTTAIELLENKKLYRRSDRQGRKIVMDGVLGEFAVIGLDEESFHLLKLGEILGAGKQTTFGLGKLKVEEIKS